MSPQYSQKSSAELSTCHPDLRTVFDEVIKYWDCTILEGIRSSEQQKKNVERGVSKKLESRHLAEFSRYPAAGVDAVDVAPYPLQWPKRPVDDSENERIRWMKDMARYYYFAGFVLGVAARMGIKLRHGGDWDGDRDVHDQSFDDLPHFELVR